MNLLRIKMSPILTTCRQQNNPLTIFPMIFSRYPKQKKLFSQWGFLNTKKPQEKLISDNIVPLRLLENFYWK